MTSFPSKYAGRCRACAKSWHPNDVIFRDPKREKSHWCVDETCATDGRASDGGERAVRPKNEYRQWPALVLQLAPPEFRPRVYRALALTLHPDAAGGDAALMVELNNARDELGA